MFCTNCGEELPDNTKICTNCGAIPKIPVEPNTNNLSNDDNGQDIVSTNVEHYHSYPNGKDNIAIDKINKPLSTSTFFFIQLLFLIPVINLLFILIWSFKKNTNLNLKSYSRSMLIWYIITSLLFTFMLLTLSFLQYPIYPSAWLNFLKSL